MNGVIGHWGHGPAPNSGINCSVSLCVCTPDFSKAPSFALHSSVPALPLDVSKAPSSSVFHRCEHRELSGNLRILQGGSFGDEWRLT